MNIVKAMTYGFILLIIVKFIKNLQVIFHFRATDDIGIIVLTSSIIFSAWVLHKHRHWRIACVFLAVNELIKFLLIYPLKSIASNEYKSLVSYLMILGTMMVLLSFYYVLRFLKSSNFKDLKVNKT